MRPFIHLWLLLLAANQVTAASLYYEIEEFGLPGQGQMVAFDINNHNEIVGYVDHYGSGSRKPTGFLRDADGITLLDVPGSGPINGSRALGINDAGQIVGRFTTEDGAFETRGYLYEDGVYTTIDVPESRSTVANDINSEGVIVGTTFVLPYITNSRGFILDHDDFALVPPDDDNPSLTIEITGINDHGNMVGQVKDGLDQRSFAIIDGEFIPFTFPGDPRTRVLASGINNENQIVGSFSVSSSDFHGFLMDRSGIYQFDVPGADFFGTSIFGINDGGYLVGRAGRSRFPFNQALFLSPCSEPGTNCVEMPRIGDSVLPLAEPGTLLLVFIGLFGLALRQGFIRRRPAVIC